ncbi:MAG: M1 family metallopeptidase [Chryseolinea sp.]
MIIKNIFAVLFVATSGLCVGQGQPNWQGKFEQMDQALPTPNEYRTGSGSPGPKYWQQKADYVISIELNDENQTIQGKETITYNNNSPDVLKYLWLQLDQNVLANENSLTLTSVGGMVDSAAAKTYAMQVSDFKAGFAIKTVSTTAGAPLPHTINNTMMSVDLPQPLKPGEKYAFNVEWSFNIVDRSIFGQRSGLEYFPEDKNYIYTIAQFFPRMCVYDDYEGWQNKQFLGRSEFTLPFGDYKVRITVPADHMVAATGTLKNATEVLTKTEIERFNAARSSFDKPLMIVTQAEATQKEKTKSAKKKTWEFHADNVRDFAFASSRKFLWDAQAVKIGDKTPLAMSYYPKEGNPLWERESTKAVKNTLEVYSRFTIDYPYPVAISVHTASIGMEYPMICFNYGRPAKDGTYSPLTRQNTISVIIHEVGHNFFPMIINSDERQSTWMDEGIDSFVQLMTQMERYPDIAWSRGTPLGLTPYLKGDKSKMRPLMTNGDQVIEFGSEQYTKAATGLFMLRETIMGKELFDKAFKEYAQRWAFKHPKPADFFRTMEDASAVDLDWFWKGWFYTTDDCDQSIDKVRWFRLRKEEADPEKKKLNVAKGDLNASSAENKFEDFSSGAQPFSVIGTDNRLNGEFMSQVDDKAIAKKLEDKNIYEVTFSNKGGLVMPVIIQWTYKDGTTEVERIPAEIWRMNEQRVTKVFVKQKEVTNITLDPKTELTDINVQNNVFPKRSDTSTKFDEFKKKSK